jgi:cytochrome P450
VEVVWLTREEETLRFEPPVTLIPRIALEDFDVHGQAIRQGQLMQLSIASANRDSANFPDPERFRTTRTPGRHLSFGHGPHGCLGASLAWVQTATALTTLWQRFPGLRSHPADTVVPQCRQPRA